MLKLPLQDHKRKVEILTSKFIETALSAAVLCNIIFVEKLHYFATLLILSFSTRMVIDMCQIREWRDANQGLHSQSLYSSYRVSFAHNDNLHYWLFFYVNKYIKLLSLAFNLILIIIIIIYTHTFIYTILLVWVLILSLMS